MVGGLMLYMMGALMLDTHPFSADSMDRDAGADLAVKPVIGGLAPSEFMGEGEDRITLAGRLIPSKIGGMSELERAHAMRRAGTRFPLMRGDGRRLGTFAITRIGERHTDLMADGVGFVVEHTIAMRRAQASEATDGLAVIDGILSLFDAISGGG